MDLILFGKALIIGLSIAAPVGPIGLICIQRTLTQGARAGIASGLGAATADGIYGAIGAFGLSAVTQAFASVMQWISRIVLTGPYVIYNAMTAVRKHPTTHIHADHGNLAFNRS